MYVSLMQFNRTGFIYALETHNRDGVIPAKKATLLLLENKLRDLPAITCNKEDFLQNKFVSVYVEQLEKNCRGIITNVTDVIHIYLIDYGLSLKTPIGFIKPLPTFANIKDIPPLIAKIAMYGIVSSYLKGNLIDEPRFQNGNYWFSDDITVIKNVLQAYEFVVFELVEEYEDFKFGHLRGLEKRTNAFISINDMLVKTGKAVKMKNFRAIIPKMVQNFRKSKANIDFNV